MGKLSALDKELESLEAKKPQQALELATQMLNLAKNQSDYKAQAQALRHSGICFASLGSLKDAEKYARKSVELCTNQSLDRLQLRCANTYAGILLSQGKLLPAQALLENNLEQASKSGLIEEKARFFNSLGIIYSRQGDYPKALKIFIQSIDLKRGISDPRGLAQSLHNIAYIYLLLEMFQKAVKHDQEALAILEKIGDLRGQPSVLNCLGEAASGRKDYEAAEKLHDKAISIARESGDVLELAESLVLRVKCANGVQAKSTVKFMLDEAMHLAISSGDEHSQARVLLELARILMFQEKTEQALIKLYRAKQLVEQRYDELLLCETYQLISEALAQQRDYEGAYKYLLMFNQFFNKLKGAGVAKRIQVATVPLELKIAQAEAEVLQLQNQELEILSQQDHLTGLANRRYLQKQLDLIEDSTALSMLILDIDYFKSINDRFSHFVGDEVLRRSGKILQACCPVDGLAVRFGGEEFVLLLPEVDLDHAIVLAEKIRKQFEQYCWVDIAKDLFVTVSIGVANSNEDANVDAVLQLADSRLYQAKRTDRNKVVPVKTIH